MSEFDDWIRTLKQRHGVSDELKWHKIRKGHGAINCTLDLLHGIAISDDLTYDALVVHKELYRNWQGNSQQQELAFYKTYTQLLRYVANRTQETIRVLIDNRVDTYGKQHEVVETIGNHMLNKLESSGRLDAVEKVDSKKVVGIQAVDVLTGAITAAHQCHLNPNFKIHLGKQVAIRRLASLLGWDDLCYDTMPDPKLNVWHFPIEYRAIPRTRKYKLRNSIPYVSAMDLK